MINFSEVQNSVKDLKKQLAADQIDDKAFEDRLLAMIDVAEDGYYWMFGHESERWFRHNGEQWVPDDPSRISATRPETNVSAPNPDNGQNSELEEIPVNTAWLVISLCIIIVIGCVVYLSSLAYNL